MEERSPELARSYHLHRMAGSARLFTLLGVMSSGMATEFVAKSAELAGWIKRDVLMEPWDVPDHVGNFTEAGLYTSAAFSLLALRSVRRGGEDSGRSLRNTALAAFAISTAIQLAGEKYGALIPGVSNQPDMIDAAYGIGFSAVAATLCRLGYRSARNLDERSFSLLRERQEDADMGPSDHLRSARPEKIRKAGPNPEKKHRRKQQQASRRKNRPK